jgi:hypothetical protein
VRDSLNVQRNYLLNGFDSSTEKKRFFGVFCQKKEVAPFKVKKRNFYLVRREFSGFKKFFSVAERCVVLFARRDVARFDGFDVGWVV